MTVLYSGIMAHCSQFLQYATESTKDMLKNFLTNQDVLKTSDTTRMQWPSDGGGGGGGVSVQGGVCRGGGGYLPSENITFLQIRWRAVIKEFLFVTAGLYYATRDMDGCTQKRPSFPPEEIPYSETCLHLNIWVPQPMRNGREVMVRNILKMRLNWRRHCSVC